MIFKRKRKIQVEPYEIFLDTKNMPDFNQQQFEGRIEKAISKKSLFFLSFFFILIGISLVWRLSVLQIINGEKFLERSQRNSLIKKVIFSERGIIYDRNKKELVWNKKDSNEEKDFLSREYLNKDGFSHLLGYLSLPQKDKSGFYWQKEFVGLAGIEKQYDDLLKGENGIKISEINNLGEIQSENMILPAKEGQNLTLTIDSRLQEKLFELISIYAKKAPFVGGAGVLLDVNNGEVLSLASFPEYKSSVMTEANDSEMIKGFLKNEGKVFMNRAIGGIYTPGSIIKPFVAIGALNEKIIDPLKKIFSAGFISIPNPYFPDKKSIFKDWKAHGYVDMRKALAVSSNVYFYTIGGGFEDQKGLGIEGIEKYMRIFNLGEKTGIDLPGEINGVIPSIPWKEKKFPGDPWRVGDTYNTAIGQYGFQITPIQIARALAILVNNGNLIKPTLLKNNDNEDKKIIVWEKVQENFNNNDIEIVKEGMRQVVTQGTAIGLNSLPVKIAAKTGTAQVGISKKFMNSWVIGFFPYEQPRYVFVILMEKASSTNSLGAALVAHDFIDWMYLNTPEYFK